MNIPRDLSERILHYPSFEDWLKGYLNFTHYWIGGSMVSDLLGIGYGTAWGVWRRYKAGVVEEHSEEELRDLERGKEQEEFICAVYERRTGAEVARKPCRVVHPEHPWAVVSPDALVRRDGVLGLLEAKTARDRYQWGRSGSEIQRWEDGVSEKIVPPRYAAQCFWAMEVTGLPFVDLVVALPDQTHWMDYRFFRIWRDEKTQARIFRQVAKWREKHLLGGEEPPIDGSEDCRAELASRYPTQVEGLRAPSSDEEEEVVRAYIKAKTERKFWEQEEKRLQNEMLAHIQGGRGISLPGGERVVVVRAANKAPSCQVYGVEKMVAK